MIKICQALAEAIMALGSVPSGHLYALGGGDKIGLTTYTTALDILKGAGLVSERNHVLTWIGPKIAGKPNTLR